MITGLIVGAALVFMAGFLVAWWLRPDLRAWVERPKYRFQANVQHYDHTRCERGKSA